FEELRTEVTARGVHGVARNERPWRFGCVARVDLQRAGVLEREIRELVGRISDACRDERRTQSRFDTRTDLLHALVDRIAAAHAAPPEVDAIARRLAATSDERGCDDRQERTASAKHDGILPA